MSRSCKFMRKGMIIACIEFIMNIASQEWFFLNVLAQTWSGMLWYIPTTVYWIMSLFIDAHAHSGTGWGMFPGIHPRIISLTVYWAISCVLSALFLNHLALSSPNMRYLPSYTVCPEQERDNSTRAARMISCDQYCPQISRNCQDLVRRKTCLPTRCPTSVNSMPFHAQKFHRISTLNSGCVCRDFLGKFVVL